MPRSSAGAAVPGAKTATAAGGKPAARAAAAPRSTGTGADDFDVDAEIERLVALWFGPRFR
jgi:hypothetical protein